MENNKNQITENTNKIKISLITIMLGIVLLYFIYCIYILIKNPTSSVVVEKGTLYQEEECVGYIIRDEVVVSGDNYKNGLVPIKAEGSKVAKGDAIFRYYTENEDELNKKISDLDLQIQEALKNQENVFSADIKNLDKLIEENLNKLSATNDISKIKEIKKNISNAITKKAKITGDLSPSGSYIRQLINERSQYESQLNTSTEYVKAPQAGVVSYRIDNLESELTPNSFNSINKDYLEKLNLKTGQIIASNNEKGKIVNSFECYIAINLKSKEAKDAAIADKINLRLANSEEIPAEIVYKSDDKDDTVLLILKINKKVEYLIKYRKISLDIIWWSSTGLKVPNTAIKEENNLNYIVRSRAGYMDKILVKILKQNDNYAIVDNYTSSELKDLGYSSTEIEKMKKIMIYDEIITKK